MEQATISTQPQQISENEKVDLMEYWRILVRHKTSIFSLAFTSALVATLVVFSIKPTYQSTATLLIEAEDSNVVSIEEVYGITKESDEYFQTQFGILRSRDLTDKVISKLKLNQHKEFFQEKGTVIAGFDWRSYLSSDLLTKWFPAYVDGVTDEAEVRQEELVADFRSV